MFGSGGSTGRGGGPSSNGNFGGATGNFGGASSMGGGGNMSGQEMRGTGGLLGMAGRDSMNPFGLDFGPSRAMQEEDRLRKMLEDMGIDINALGGGGAGQGGGQQQPQQGAMTWAFPQYTQSWLPKPPAVPPMTSPPPFRR